MVGRTAAVSEHDDGSKDRIVCRAHHQLPRMRQIGHRLQRESFDFRIGNRSGHRPGYLMGGGDDTWVKKLMEEEPDDMKNLARAAVSMAGEIYGESDDMTVLAVRLEQRA